MNALLKPREQRPSEVILGLAAKYGISYTPSILHELGDAITSLSGDDVQLDHTQRILIELGRAKVIDGRTQIALATAYQDEL
jgi:hypothetical protein